MILYLQRHCEPQDGDLHSRTLGLSEDGKQQADRVADWLKSKVDLCAILSSPFARCEQTARADAEKFGLTVEVSETLASVDPKDADPGKIWKAAQLHAGPVLLVSHQEVLEPLLKWFRGKTPKFEWGSVACLEVDELAEQPVGHLHWFVTIDDPSAVADPAVASFSRAVDLLIKDFVIDLSHEVEQISGAVAEHLVGNIKTSDGAVLQNSENSQAILGAEAVFEHALDQYQAYPLVTALVSNLGDLAREFKNLHPDRLQQVQLEDDDREVLADHAASAMTIIEGEFQKVQLNLRRFLSRSLGDGQALDQIVSGAITAVNRMNRVEPIVVDQVLTWLRLHGSIWFGRAEESTELRYKYAGPFDESTREFCKKLLKQTPVTREEIQQLDNGQLPDAMVNAGGYGCRHFWLAEVAA